MCSGRAPVLPTLQRLRRIGEWTSGSADRRGGGGSVGSMSRETQSLQTNQPLHRTVCNVTESPQKIL
ncbi:MAG: hypothetical protein WAV28_02390 [Sedimentisphaerales bacterium]